jgi:hypothetical protein
MELVHEFDLHAELGDSLVPGAGPLGTRMIVSVASGSVKGDRINGKVAGAGADWVMVGPDDYGRIDVRMQVVTDDAAVIYIAYTGLLELSDRVVAAMMGTGTTDFGDQYFRTTPRLETGDARYAWVNTTLFVAEGRITESGVEYRTFRVT